MDDIITRLKNNDQAAFREVYQSSFKICARLILQLGGDEASANDIFQEAMLILLRKLRQPDFEISSQISTYLYGICKNLWRRELAKNASSKITLTLDKDEAEFLEQPMEESHDERHHKLLEHTLEVLKTFAKEDCSEIIRLFYFDNYSLQQIAEHKNYTVAYAKKKKFNCMQYLKKEIKSTYKIL